MKIPSSRRRGFTLVELLVVIAIIAVLAAAGFAAGNAAINKAKRVIALASATGIESAVSNFYNEYNSMPTRTTTSDSDVTVVTDTAQGIELLEILLGLEKAEDVNTRRVRFLSVKEGKNKKNGLIYSTDGKSVEGLYDPWGGPYHVIMDLDYDERVTPDRKSTTTQKALNGRRVAVWTDGADYKEENKAADDVTTW